MKLSIRSLALLLCLHNSTYAEYGLLLNEYDYPNFNEMSLNESTPSQKLSLQDFFMQGNTALNSGNIDEAITYFMRGTQTGKSPQLCFNLGIAYERKGEIDKAIEAYKDAIVLKPDYFKAHFQLATLLQKKGNSKEAIIHYQHAANLDHHHTEANLSAARLLCEQEQFNESLPYFERALRGRPDDIMLKFEYANTLTISNRNEEALARYHDLLEMHPNDSGILYNTAFTLKKLGRISQAMPFYQAALARNPNHTEARFSLGLAHLTLGNFKEGWPLYEYRWKRNSQLTPRNFAQPQWDGSPLNGKTILIHAEQGLGDTFQFIRYVRKVKEQQQCSVIFAVQAALETIVSRCCPYIDRVVTLSAIPTSFDVQIPLMSLPLIFNTDLDTIPAQIPYLFPDETLVKYWKQELATNTTIKVGICFQGNNKYSTAQLRAAVSAKSLLVNQFAPLSKIEGVTLYCLQKETGTEQLNQLSSHFTLKQFDETFDGAHGRFMDTAAVMKNLDLVITVDTSIAHLAGAIGIPTWIILPEPADWRWMLNRCDTPWYPTVKLFRQPTTGDWNSIIQTIQEELVSFVQKKLSEPKRTSDAVPSNPMAAPQAMSSPISFDQLLHMRILALKDIDITNREICIAELKKAHRLYKIYRIMEELTQENA